MEKKNLNKYIKITQNLTKYKKYDSLFLLDFFIKQSDTFYTLDSIKNIQLLKSGLNFIKCILKGNGKVLFILPNNPNYIKVNSKFINIIKQYQHSYILQYNKNKPGFLTNYKINSKNKKINLVLIFHCKSDSYYRNIIKESNLMNIPIFSFINIKDELKSINFPVISNINKKSLSFFYYLIITLIKKYQKPYKNEKKV